MSLESARNQCSQTDDQVLPLRAAADLSNRYIGYGVVNSEVLGDVRVGRASRDGKNPACSDLSRRAGQ